MAYYNELTFREDAFHQDYMQGMRECHIYAMSCTKQAIRSIDAWSAAYELAIDDFNSYIVTDSVKAFVQIYGSGIGMASASDNPFLKDYLNSKYYNKGRSKKAGALINYRPEKFSGINWTEDKFDDNMKGSGGDMNTPLPDTYQFNLAENAHLEKMQKVLDTYLKYLNEYFSVVVIPDLNTNLNNGKYTTVRRVKV